MTYRSEDPRLAEIQTYEAVRRAYRKLADTPFYYDQRRKERLQRLEAMKAEWWRCLQAVDEEHRDAQARAQRAGLAANHQPQSDTVPA